MSQQFNEISVCPHCNAPTVERYVGTEGWTFCSDECGCLEGERLLHKYECSKCWEVCDAEYCSCEDWLVDLEQLKEFGWSFESIYQSAGRDWYLKHALHGTHLKMEKSLKGCVEWVIINYVMSKEWTGTNPLGQRQYFFKHDYEAEAFAEMFNGTIGPFKQVRL